MHRGRGTIGVGNVLVDRREVTLRSGREQDLVLHHPSG